MRELSAEQSDLKLRSTFFRSVTVVTSAAAIILAGSEGLLFPAACTPVFALVGWLLAEHLRWFRIPVIIGNLFGVAAFAVAANEFIGGTLESKLLAGAHLIVYLTWIVLILPKSNRQYWWLIALSVLQLAIAGLLSGGVTFGASMLGMLLLLLWTLSVFSLFRVQDQHARRALVRSADALSSSPDATRSFSATGTPINKERGDSSTQTSAEPARSSEKSGNSRRFLLAFLGLNNLLSRSSSAASRSRETAQPTILVRNGLQRDPSETWVGWRFRWMVGGSYLISVALALIVFAAFPRVWVPGSALFGDVSDTDSGYRNRLGFSDSVQLGDIGEIMLSNERVLAFEISNLKTGRKVDVDQFAEALKMDEIRFRGNVMAFYNEGVWTRGFEEKGFGRGEDIRRLGEYNQLPSDFRLQITQDPPAAVFAFSPYPVSRVATNSGARIVQTEISGSLIWMGGQGAETVARTFTVDCPSLEQRPGLTFEFWATPEDLPPDIISQLSRRRFEFASSIYLMDGMEGPMYRRKDGVIVEQPREYSRDKDLEFRLPKLFQTANAICTENQTLVPPAERVRRIVKYLSNDNGFVYSLKQSRQDRSLDPLEDFLLNTKSGHCEYYASACVLMLQSVDVPARLINGYYGSEINGLSGRYEVRQRHAHAWAEAFVDDRWLTVEATPSSDRRQDMDNAQPVTLISNIQTAISDFWNDGIHQMSAERQQEFFAPVISTSKSLFQTIRDKGLWNTIRQQFASFISSRSSWISWQGGIALFVLLVTIAGLAKLKVFRKLMNAIRTLQGRLWQSRRSSRSVIRFYEGFCHLCERNGLNLPPANSALENASLAFARFNNRLATPDLQTLPTRIAIAFNEVRFGHLSLTDEQAESIHRDLLAFADALKHAHTAPSK